MDKHIELVKKWLADPDSVTQEELCQNSDAAEVADAYNAFVYFAAYAAAYDAVYDAVYWVKRYEALENDDE